MAKCLICLKEKPLEKCKDCNGTGNAASGAGFCPFCNGERTLCADCQD